ncbi:hypothetical protein SPBR_01820 [Sporothrix brasiliensis 5110]|uniref:ARID domain-containing protein n=1 Tax=Sporothrix brasiliensis 5110 TaxID=1398154 RepID=A0A0C2J2P2_9PEZI|nr:uncharacterized protein SPBR_01820 [Sporothrix brasiliensis 5110]KIH91357.1 hypothetical protein SPBR_01820 [Sporothrix brasiliensis 5110]
MYTKGDAAPAAAPGTIPQSQTQNGTSNGEQGNPQEDTEENDGGDDGLDLDDDAILNGVGDHDNQQQVFQKCLDEYNDYLGVYVPPSFFIGGRFLDTYSLWTALQDAADDGDRINWDSVVETLGLDSTKYTLLASQLAAWYDFNLKEFRSFWIRYKEVTEASGSDEEGEDEEGGEEDEGEVSDGEAEAAEADVQAPSGNPAPGTASRSRGLVDVVRGLFRSSEAHPDAPAPESPSKHVRFSGAEGDGGAGDVGGDSNEEEDSDEEDDEDGFQTRRGTRSGARQRTPTKTRTVEPETQDFAFGNETQAPTDLGGDGENEDDEGGFDEVDAQMRGAPGKATPTRQLRSEDRAVASVPRSLPAPGSTKRKRTAAAPSAASPSKRQQRKPTA